MPRLPLFLLPFSEVVVKDVTPSLHGALHTLRAVASEKQVDSGPRSAHTWRPAATPASKQLFGAVFGNVKKPSAQEAYQYWQQNVSRSPNLPRNDFTAQGLRGCLLRWHERAEVPQVWRSIEQVHIHKPDSTPGASDGASAAKDEANFDSKCCLRGCGQCMGPEPFHQSLD